MKQPYRDEAIEIITSNMIMAGLLLPHQVSQYMSRLHMDCDNEELGVNLKATNRLWQMTLEVDAVRRAN